MRCSGFIHCRCPGNNPLHQLALGNRIYGNTWLATGSDISAVSSRRTSTPREGGPNSRCKGRPRLGISRGRSCGLSAWLKEQSHKATIEQDKAHLRWLDRHLSGKQLDLLSRHTVDRLTEAKLHEGVSNATVNRLLEIVRAILRRCVNQWEWLDRARQVRPLGTSSGAYPFPSGPGRCHVASIIHVEALGRCLVVYVVTPWQVVLKPLRSKRRRRHRGRPH